MSRFARASRDRGFALVLTLALLALLVLAVFALSVLVRTSARVAEGGARQVQARQNAQLALSVALGELQKNLGIDAVVTARSSVRAKSTKYGCLLGIWPSGSLSALPDNWLVSGNIAPDPPRSITYSSLPAEADPFVTLLGGNTVTSSVSGAGYARARKLEIPSTGGDGAGHFAFWIEDEGTKASLNVPPAMAPLAPSSHALVADPRGEIPSFQFGSSDLVKALTFEQLVFVVGGGVSLKSKFHDYTSRAMWVNGGGGLSAGLFNINTTSAEAWAAILRTYDAARGPEAGAIGDRVGDLADKLTGNFGNCAVAGGKVRSGPFLSVEALWASNLVGDSLTEAQISDVTQDDIQDVISPMLAVRSDTFRIRAYGDVTNPVTGGREAIAYCEAIVQRTPDMIDAVLGRRFVITYFRWLGPDDI